MVKEEIPGWLKENWVDTMVNYLSMDEVRGLLRHRLGEISAR